MNRLIERAFRPLLISTAALVAFPSLVAPAQSVPTAGTFVVRSGPKATVARVAPAPADIIAGQAVGEQFCNALQCVVFTSAPAQIAALTSLQSQGLVTLEPLPDARKIYFAKSLYDADTDAFEADFPGRTETTPLLSNALFAVVFKAWPERAWIDALEKAGLQPVAPMQSMAWLLYGPRSAISQLPKRFSTIYKTTDLPAGLKRFNLDTREAGDDDGPQWTYVHVVAAASETVAGLLRTQGGTEPGIIDRTPTVISYTSLLTRQEAIDFASFPEVLSVRRMSRTGGPSDERSNRIVGGNFAIPGTTYTQAALGTYPPNYWNNYLSSLSGIGINPANQTIGFLDTGIDAGLTENGVAYCPRFLRPASPCPLVFTQDTTIIGHNDPNMLADDFFFHGTLVSSVAAGNAGADSPGRDPDGYAFSQGVAQGARLAVSKIFGDCRVGLTNLDYRTVGGTSLWNMQDRLRYSLVELSTLPSTTPPDSSLPGPGATLFNHSWYTGAADYDYDEAAVILDRSTRRLNYYSFTFDNGATLWGASGQPTPALHVVAAGNDYAAGQPPYPDPGPVQSPGTARNVITVGASESYNQQGYGIGTCPGMDTTDANDQRQVALFSRIGWTFNRAKPDLVAPGTRSYGGSTGANNPCPQYPCNDNLTNAGAGQPHYQWASGTSFAAPVVTGAAALVRDWLRTLNFTNPSPALTKAALLTATKNLAPCNPACTNPPPSCTTCSYCGTMLPRPDRHQGWGGLSLDQLFRPATNYYFRDQQAPYFTANGQQWVQMLAVVDHTRPIEITLAWTDAVTIANLQTSVATLVNDLDLRLDLLNPGNIWTGDYYYTCRTCCDRTGWSIPETYTLTFDHKNNVERISIPANTFSLDGTLFFLTVTATSLQGDGIDPAGNTPRQDFAIAVSNAH